MSESNVLFAEVMPLPPERQRQTMKDKNRKIDKARHSWSVNLQTLDKWEKEKNHAKTIYGERLWTCGAGERERERERDQEDRGRGMHTAFKHKQ